MFPIAAQGAPSEMPDLARPTSRLDDEEFSRFVLRDGAPLLGLTLDELLNRSRTDKAVA